MFKIIIIIEQAKIIYRYKHAQKRKAYAKGL